MVGKEKLIDAALLESWGLLRDYRRNRAKFLELAQIVYRTVEEASGREPSPEECELVLSVALEASAFWKHLLMTRSHLRPALYRVMTAAMARHILSTEWDEIVSR